MTVYDRLGYNFPTAQFGSASALSDGAKNTLGVIANNTPTIPAWQKTDLAAGPITRTNYFYNRAATYCDTIKTSADSIKESANLAGNASLVASAAALSTSVSAFKSHTNNISGVSIVTSANTPSYDSASAIGQQSMMTLTRTDGQQTDTTPILGSFTSLFIQDTLSSNAGVLSGQSSGFSSSITVISGVDGNGNPTTTFTTSYSGAQMSDIQSYVISTTSVLDTRRTHDFTFYNNSVQVAKDNGFLSQFTSMGGTNTYLINNVCGTDSLKAKIASANTA